MHSIQLDKYELLLIESMLSPSEIQLDSQDNVLPPSIPSKGLCLKIGSLLLEAMSKNEATVEAHLDEMECWILRERISVFASTGNRPVGQTIKVKLYDALLKYDDDKVLYNTRLVTGNYTDMTAKEVKRVLENREYEDGRGTN